MTSAAFMLALVLMSLLAAAARGAGARSAWPPCPAARACAALELRASAGWLTRYYIVDGERLSVSLHDGSDELRWRCARGADALSAAAPRFDAPRQATALRLEGCRAPLDHSYSELLQHLNIDTNRLGISFYQTQPFNAALLTKLTLSELAIHSERKVVKLENDFSHFDGTLKRLSLQQISITVDQLKSAWNVVDLSLVNTGLKEIPVLSKFTRLERLSVREACLLNTSWLGTAPALRDLTLEAPDAGVPYLPLLKNATFINFYAMERFFGDCSNLESLVMERGLLSGLRAGLLAGCARLRRLRLTHLPRLAALPPRLLAAAAALQHLDLSHNALEALPEMLLADTVALTFLNLSHNKLSALPNDLLNRTTHLVHLDLSHNLLATIPGNLLSNTKILEHLDLSHNQLKALPDSFLASADDIASGLNLDISYNELQDFLSVNKKYFKKLNLKYNVELHDEMDNELPDAHNSGSGVKVSSFIQMIHD